EGPDRRRAQAEFEPPPEDAEQDGMGNPQEMDPPDLGRARIFDDPADALHQMRERKADDHRGQRHHIVECAHAPPVLARMKVTSLYDGGLERETACCV